jgi:hypothetical protein
MQALAIVHRGEGSIGLRKVLLENEENFWEPKNLREKLAKATLASDQPSVVSELVWRYDQRAFLKKLPENLRLELAQYLVEQGQPKLALLALEGLQKSNLSSELSARTFAQSGRENEAISLASEFTTRQLEPRLSEVVMSENPDIAWEMRDNLSGVAVERVAWISQRWSEVETDDIRGETSLLLVEAQKARIYSDKPIQDAQDAQIRSRKTRRVLEELLEQ